MIGYPVLPLTTFVPKGVPVCVQRSDIFHSPFWEMGWTVQAVPYVRSAQNLVLVQLLAACKIIEQRRLSGASQLSGGTSDVWGDGWVTPGIKGTGRNTLK